MDLETFPKSQLALGLQLTPWFTQPQPTVSTMKELSIQGVANYPRQPSLQTPNQTRRGTTYCDIQSIESDNQHHIRRQVKVTAQEETRKLRENNSGIKEHGEDLSVAQTTVLQLRMDTRVR